MLLLAFLSLYNPGQWLSFPSLDNIRCISFSNRDLYLAVPQGVCIVERRNFRLERTLTQADGLEGETRLCAWNPLRSSLFIATDGHLYEYLPGTGTVQELPAPFSQVKSIGITSSAVFFDTDKGLFQKHRVAPLFTEAREPGVAEWFGERDSSRPQDFVFLAPYFVTDDQLQTHRILRVRADPRSRRLFAAADNYGLLVYNISSGFSEAHVRFGPPGLVRRIVEQDGRLWFLGDGRTASLDSAGNWSYYYSGSGSFPVPGISLLLPQVLDLNRTRRLRAAVPADSGAMLFATDYGLYRLDPDFSLTQVFDLDRPVYSLARLGDSILAGTDAGLYLVTADSLITVLDPSARFDFGVYDIARTSVGSTFFATLGGIVLRDSAGNWDRLLPPGTDLSRPVQALAAVGDHLFVGTPDGLSILEPDTRHFTPIDRSSGLPSSDITALFAGPRFLWIASPGMVTRLEYRPVLPHRDRN
ncbi:MAG: hypothetical protein ABIK37_03615 [candidate division WOR-3 bacterium]